MKIKPNITATSENIFESSYIEGSTSSRQNHLWRQPLQRLTTIKATANKSTSFRVEMCSYLSVDNLYSF